MKTLYFLFSSSLLIGLVLLFRKVFRKKLSPEVIYALWMIPLIRFMIPFVLWEVPIYSTVVDVLNIPYRVVSEWMVETEDFSEQIGTEYTTMTVQSNEDEITENKNESVLVEETVTEWTEAQTTMTTTPVPVQTSDTMDIMKMIQNICCGIWIIGSVLIGTYTLFSNRKLYKYVKTAEKVDIINEVSVYLNDEITVPCLTGMIHPKILVNSEVRNNTQLYEYILQHEMTHFKQKDHIWTGIKIFLCVIYWWNPLVWVAVICAGEDAEVACDAKVLKGKSKEERKAYGYALLLLLENTQKNRKIIYAATSMFGSRKNMKRRIEEIADETKTRKAFLIISVLILGFTFVIGCTIPAQNMSSIKTNDWKIVDREESSFHETKFDYELKEDIQSGLIYYELYEYGTLTQRSILSYGNIKEKKGNIKISRTYPKNLNTDGNPGWMIEFNGIDIELEKPIYDYDVNGHSSTALNDENVIQIKPEDDFVLIADFGGKNGESGRVFDCKQLSVYTQKELQEHLKDNYVTVLLRFVVSGKDAQELYDTYAKKESASNENMEIMEENDTGILNEKNTQNPENEGILEFDTFLDAVANNSIEDMNWGNFSNINRKFFHEHSLTYNISYDLEFENHYIRLDFYYRKEEDQLGDIFIHKEDDSTLWVYDSEKKQRVSDEEIIEFIRWDNNILNEISFKLPEDLTMSAYSADTGYEGGCLFLPMVYKGDEQFTPDFWMASGMVSRYTQSVVLIWDGDMISGISPYFNHTSQEVIEQVDGLSAPSLLVHFNHDLYTAGGLGELEEQGIDISTIETTSDYWYLFIAQPEEEYGYVITLNQRNFTKDDILNLGKTIEILNH